MSNEIPEHNSNIVESGVKHHELELIIFDK